MKQKFTLFALIGLVTLFWSGPAFSADVDELKRQIDILSDEMDNLKGRSGGSGSKQHNRVSIHGYGEVHLQAPTSGANQETTIDAHRFVIGVHALLADWIHLNAEIDFEGAAQELEMEFAQLDFLLTDSFNVRAGVMLAPVGLLNEFHEPTLFWTTERPELQVRMIPSSWSVGGAGIYGTPMEGVNYRLYVVNSLQSISDNSTTDGRGNGNGGNNNAFSSNGIRDGRGSQINQRIAEDFAVTGRVELTKLYPGLQVGFSTFLGDTTQGYIDAGGFITLVEADIKYRHEWFEMNSSIVSTHIADTGAINNFCSIAGNSCGGGVAKHQYGVNVQAGVHLPQLMGWKTTHDIVPHFMYERVRTQDDVVDGFAPSLNRNRNAIYTFGVAYLPIPAVSIKADHTHTRLENDTETNEFRMSVAYMY